MSTYGPDRLLFGIVFWLVASAPVAAQQPLSFYTITPCRLVDTRDGQGPLQGGFDRWVPVGSHCGIPADAVSATLNFTAVDANAAANLSAYPAGVSSPGTSVVAFNAGVTRAANATIKVNASGILSVLLSGSFSNQTHLVVDVSGYFRPQLPTQQWRSWEQVLLSTIDYTTGGANPHADVELEVRFTRTSTNDAFIQGAFWGGDLVNPRAFKVRTALPPQPRPRGECRAGPATHVARLRREPGQGRSGRTAREGLYRRPRCSGYHLGGGRH